jgi:photosystem II stability/assembly factor-like uncharacterized protein
VSIAVLIGLAALRARAAAPAGHAAQPGASPAASSQAASSQAASPPSAAPNPAAAGAGPRWEAQQSGVTARFRGVSAVSETVAWSSGSGGTVVRTDDGGKSWQTLTVPGAEKLDFRDVDAIDAQTAFILSIGFGEASTIYKTADAGAHWTRVFLMTDPKGFLDAMTFWDAQHGIVIGDSIANKFSLMTTGDGGKTWTPVAADHLPAALDNEGAFAASGSNLAVSGGEHVWLGTGAAATARVLRSPERGRTWRVVDSPIPAGPSSGIFSIAFRDTTHGVIVGGDYKKEGEATDNLAVTSDGGATWTLVTGAAGSRSALSGFRSAVAYIRRSGLPTPALLAVGPSGSDFSTTDGKQWTAIEGDGFHALSVTKDGRAAWAVGEKGRIAKLAWR